MIFTNARLIFPDAICDGLELVAEEGTITAIREQTQSGGEGVINLQGNYLAPGFIDLHVHGALGRDTMEASAEAFRCICDFHASGGTTSLLLTTATAPLDNLGQVLNAVRDCIRRRGRRGDWRPTSPIAGVHIEGPFISKARCGAQRAEFIQDPSAADVRQLLKHADVIKRVTIAPELPGALEAIENFCTHGISVSGGHSDAWDEDARAAFENGMRSVTHTFNCMSSARRRGTKRVAGLLEFALSEPKICCELIAEEHHVSPALMKLAYCAKGGGGIALVTDATADAGLAEGTTLQLAGKECIVKNGACFLAGAGTLAGSASRVIDLVRAMIRSAEVPLPHAIAMASLNPARAAGLPEKGEIAIGKDADLVVLSPELEVVRTYVAGSLSFRAESRNL